MDIALLLISQYWIVGPLRFFDELVAANPTGSLSLDIRSDHLSLNYFSKNMLCSPHATIIPFLLSLLLLCGLGHEETV